MTLEMILSLVALAVVSFVQNMAFTWSGRSRNSGDPNYHRYAAWSSNGIYFATNFLITVKIMEAVQSGQLWYAAIAGLVYIVATAEGSVLMMKILLKTEKGKQKVGAT